MIERPLLFIDVDGPLNPFRSDPARRPPATPRTRCCPTPGPRCTAIWAAAGCGR
ncbi:hypothetical protein ACFQXA_05735 [Nocardiopsis composta]